MNVRIVVDSTADLTPACREHVMIVPLTVHFGQEEYVDGVTLSHQQFYEKLVTSSVPPTTSQATPAAFEKVFRQIEQAGESAVVLCIASDLSGTYQSAVIAAQDFENIHVVDTGTVAIGGGILTQLAIKLALQGLRADEIAQQLEKEKENVRIVAMVDTLEYLKRGGRVSKTVAFAGDLLNIKPVLAVDRGEIRILGKARGTKQGFGMLLRQIENIGGIRKEYPVMFGYTGTDSQPLERFYDGAKEFFEDIPFNNGIIGSVIGTHAGPGAVAVAFFRKI